MPFIFLDLEAQARLDADLERLFYILTDPSSVQYDALRNEVLGVMPGIEAKLIPPQWHVVRGPQEPAIKDGFADVHDDPECRALSDAYAEMHRYVDDSPTWPQKEEYVARLTEALREYLSLRGYALPPPEAGRDQVETKPGNGPPEEPVRWLTVKEAAIAAGCNPACISRAVDDGTLKSNGRTRKKRRIDPADFAFWLLKRAQRGEAAESDEAVESKLRRAQGR